MDVYLIFLYYEIQKLYSMIRAEKKYFRSISEFKFIQNKQLGKGSFGQVRLALHILTNKLYAVKIVETKQLSTPVSIKALRKQINLHSSINHPHIIKMWQFFQQNSKVYMIMEYAERGNLFYYQNQKRAFSQHQASNFFSQVLSAIEYLHSLNLVHRDIKPENLLLDKDLNIKLCDLGWVTEGINQTHTIFCGTYEYMAPQMIFDKSYDHRVDIWALGILLYQLLHGFAPFEGDKIDQVRESMIGGQIYFDSELSTNVQNLIFNILKVNPTERLKIQEIKNHPWMIQMNKRRLSNQQQQQPSRIYVSKEALQNRNKLKKKIINFSLKILPSKKEELNKILSNRGLLKKKQNSRLRSNMSIENVHELRKSRSKEQNKQNLSKIMGKSSKRDEKGHQMHLSDFSQMLFKTKMKRQTDNRKIKEQVRFKTENGQCLEQSKGHAGLKKKKTLQKKIFGDTIILGHCKAAKHSQIIRNSID